MADQVTPVVSQSNGGYIRIPWVVLLLLGQSLAGIYGYGRLVERVDNLGSRILQIELRVNK